MNLDAILKKDNLTKEELVYLLDLKDSKDIEKLHKRAYEIKLENIGNKVYYRGLIEFSNICVKNCNYCGIRRDNKNVERFHMTKEEILDTAKWIYENGYGSIALQSGERQDEEFTDFVEDIIKEIKKIGDLGITLSLGEQSYDTYKRWFDAGAHRYLLRIESSNEKIYNSLHPKDKLHDFNTRKQCLVDLRNIGYQVGTGVMIGLPGQTVEDLANDILFYKEMDIDMIGMGPYARHKDTPMGKGKEDTIEEIQDRVRYGLNMIAVTRIFLKDVNIAATTALQALDPLGREKGLKAGANILMPITTIGKHRAKYQLYDNKPCVEDTKEECKGCLAGRVKSVGDEIVYGEWGDSPHFYNKQKNK
jgi:biotin synthase